MKFTEQLQALDDSDLTVYEFRYLVHIWRRGRCWEPVYKIAKLCHMSKSQGYRAQESLIEKGWIVRAIEDGRVILKVADTIPGTEKSNVVLVPDREQYNVVNVPVGETDFPGREKDFPGRHSLPINRTKEVNPIKSNGNGAGDSDPERQAAIEAVFDLVQFWSDLTKRPWPSQDSADFWKKWFEPFNTIWVSCGRDTNAAKAKIQQARNKILAGGGTIFDPSKLPGHVQALVDAELIPMMERMNGTSPDLLWRQALTDIANGAISDARLREAVKAIGGASAIRQANEYTTRQLKERLHHEYARIPATA